MYQMDKIEFIASYFYEKGYQNSKLDVLNDLKPKFLSEYLNDCDKAYEEELREIRRQSPHHHMNRID